MVNSLDNKGNANVTTSTTLTGSKDVDRTEKSSVRTVNFKILRATGATLPDNNFTYLRTVLQPSSGEIYQGRMTTSDTERRYSYYPHVVSGVWIPSTTLGLNGVNTRLIKRMKGNQWNVPIFFAEAGKTSKMVVQRATHLALMVNALRKGNFVEFGRKFHHSVMGPSKNSAKRFYSDYGRNSRKAVANAWLEYSYGWKPFMKDVYDATHTLLDLKDRAASTVSRVTASEKRSIRDHLYNQQLFNETELSFKVMGDYVRLGEESIRATWRFKPNALDLPARFGLVNPLEVVWELIPFSFVADWFLPIGNYLSALDVPFRVSHLGGTYGRRIQTTMTTVPKTKSGGNSKTSYSGFTGQGSYIWVQRTKMASIPTIGLLETSFKFDLSSNQVMSSISLLNQQLSRLGKR